VVLSVQFSTMRVRQSRLAKACALYIFQLAQALCATMIARVTVTVLVKKITESLPQQS
jgi:hypothetical protein